MRKLALIGFVLLLSRLCLAGQNQTPYNWPATVGAGGYFNVDTSSKVHVIAGTGGVGWGAITGTLSSQTDLQTALNAKGTGTITGVTAGTGLNGGGTSGGVTLTVRPNLTLTSITWADGTVQISSPTAGGGGTGGGLGSNCTLLNDLSSTLWAACVDTTGHLVTTSLGASPVTLAPIVLVDSSGTKWDLTIKTTGSLETELH